MAAAASADGSEFDVVVAGLGPVGATLAALLGRAGVRVLALEPSPAVYPLPRAAHIDHEAMRIFQALGLAERLQPHLRPAPDYEFRSVGGQALMRIEREGVVGACGWPVGFNIHQPGIEAELRALLATLPTVQTALGTRFDAVAQDAAGVAVRCSTDGRLRTVRARFLVGCDGASSPVRTALGIALDDFAFDEPWMVLDARVADERGFPTQNLQLCDPARPTSFVHMGPGRLRWEFMLRPGEDGTAMQRPEALAALLAPWCGHGAVEVEIERSAVYRFHGLVARQWRQRRVFLAGDAAHQMPPFMGQGMCSGLRDAVNLAWKLERALHDADDGHDTGDGHAADDADDGHDTDDAHDGHDAADAADAVLASYQTEREPHVRFIIERAIEMGRLVCTLDPEVARRRDTELLAAPRVGRPQPFPPFSTGWLLAGTNGAGEIFPQPVDRSAEPSRFLDDVLGPGAWLIVAAGVALPEGAARIDGLQVVALGSQPSDVERSTELTPRLADALAEWLVGRDAPAVLVRPDRHIFGTGLPRRLLDAWCGGHAGRTAPSDLCAPAARTRPTEADKLTTTTAIAEINEETA